MNDELLKNLEKIFANLNLDNKSAQFYLSCLSAGKTTINDISKNINTPRSTCYLILERLRDEGLIFETPFGRKRTLMAQPPHNLVNLLKAKKEQTQDIYALSQNLLPQLNEVAPNSQKPKVRFYEGIESVKQIYAETLKSKEILVFCLTQPINQEMAKFIDNYMKTIIKKGIRTKEIVSDTETDLGYMKRYSTPLNNIVSISNQYNTHTDFMIWDKRVAFISYNKSNPVGIVIEDQEVVKFEKMKFNLLWESVTLPV